MQESLSQPEPHEFPPHESVWWPKEHEQKWAAKTNFATRLAGWVVLAGFVAGLALDELNLLPLLGGAYILTGSQGWLRFMLFTSVLVLVSGALNGLVTLVFEGWDPRFLRLSFPASAPWESWLETVSIVGIVCFQGCTCYLAIRTRKLVFWTSTTRGWGYAVLALVLVMTGVTGWQSYRQWQSRRDLQAEFQPEIEAIKRHLDTRSTGSPFDPEPMLRANPRIRLVYWNENPGGFHASMRNLIYDRDSAMSWSINGDLEIRHTLPSGNAGLILLFLDPPP